MQEKSALKRLRIRLPGLHRDGLHRYRGWEEDWGSRTASLRFCLYRHQWKEELLRAQASRGAAEFRPPIFTCLMSRRSGL